MTCLYRTRTSMVRCDRRRGRGAYRWRCPCFCQVMLARLETRCFKRACIFRQRPRYLTRRIVLVPPKGNFRGERRINDFLIKVSALEGQADVTIPPVLFVSKLYVLLPRFAGSAWSGNAVTSASSKVARFSGSFVVPIAICVSFLSTSGQDVLPSTNSSPGDLQTTSSIDAVLYTSADTYSKFPSGDR